MTAQTSPHFWLGRLSAACGEAARMIEHDPKQARKYLHGALAEYVASPAPTEELRVILRGYLK